MRRIMITGARAPVALHLSRLFSAAGHYVVLADSQRFPFSRFSASSAAYVQLPAPRLNLSNYGEALTAAIKQHGIELIVPTCEEIFYLAALRDLHQLPLVLLAPPFRMLELAHNKFKFAKVAERLTGRSLGSELLCNASEVQRHLTKGLEIVLKPVWSRFGDRALLQPSPEQVLGVNASLKDPWIVQKFLPGEELCCWAFAREGTVVALQGYRPLYRVGQGASLAFERAHDSTMNEFVEAFAADLRWSGQLSFDFRRNAEGILHPIECNPRATSGLHFFQPGDQLDRTLLQGTPTRSSARSPMTMGLAMLAYGLPHAIKTSSFRRWWTDFRTMEDFTRWKGERSLVPAQLLSLAEIIAIAIQNGSSLKAAATNDIEWNGEPLAAKAPS